MIGPYRSSLALPVAYPWTSPWQRFVVRLKRRIPWTLAARRFGWRRNCRFLEWLDAQPTGVGKVTIKATNGSVVKNVYVNNYEPDMWASLALYTYRKSGHDRMPRT